MTEPPTYAAPDPHGTQPPQQQAWTPPPGPGQPGWNQAPAYAPAPPALGSATLAMVLGILSLVLCGLVTGIPAIIIGRNAVKEIDASNGQLGGRSQAQAGFIMGIVGTAVSGLAIVFVIGTFVVGLVFVGSVAHFGSQSSCDSTSGQLC